jgi:hypothetical protein
MDDRDEKCLHLFGKLERKDRPDNLGIDERVILRWI